MAASEMGFARSGHPGTRRSRPKHSGESPKHAGWPRRAQRVVQFARSAGFHPPWVATALRATASYFIAWAIKELMGDLEMCGAL